MLDGELCLWGGHPRGVPVLPCCGGHLREVPLRVGYGWKGWAGSCALGELMIEISCFLLIGCEQSGCGEFLFQVTRLVLQSQEEITLCDVLLR